MADVLPVPPGFVGVLDAYLDWMQIHGYRPQSISARRRGIREFAAWCGQRGIPSAAAVTFDHCASYAAYLEDRSWRPRVDPAPRTVRRIGRTTRVNLLGDVRAFFRYAAKHGHAHWNPAADVDGPLTEARRDAGMRASLTIAEVERVLAAPDTATLGGVRDRAILETLYSTGLRAAELVSLLPTSVYADGVVWILDGKGNKDRVIPIGRRAREWIARYRAEVRPACDLTGDALPLFLNLDDSPLTTRQLDTIVMRSLRAARIMIPGSCHLFRHTCATHLLEGGADLASVQLLLGHARMTTTSRYTHPSAEVLHAAWTKTHPAAVDRDVCTARLSSIRLPNVGPAVSEPTSWWRLRHRLQQASG